MTADRRIKIAHVITRLDWGGSPDIVRILLGRLDPARYDVTLVSGPSAHPSAKTTSFLATFRGRFIELPSLGRDLSPAADVAALAALYRLFRAEKFDLIHTHTAKAGALGRVAGRMAGCRAIVHTPHGHVFYGYFGPVQTWLAVAAERILAQWCDKQIALTELERVDMRTFGISDPARISVIYQGLELDDYSASCGHRRAARVLLGIRDGDIVVGSVGRLEPVKGHRYLLDAAARLVTSHSRLRFLFVGDGSLRRELEARAKATGLAGKCIFTGWRDDIARILPAFDLFVLPSLNEAVGMALIEAQACAVACIASRVGGIPEVLKDGVAGFLVSPANPAALERAIMQLIDDPDKRHRMGEAGRAFVIGEFNAAAMVEKTTWLYEELVGSGMGAK